MLTRSLAVLATVAVLPLLASCGDDEEQTAAADGPSCTYAETGDAAKEVDLPPTTAEVSGTVPVTMATSIGDIALELDADDAPCTVNSFVSLVEQGYFDGTTCHRLTTAAAAGIAVLQCGDPTATGTGGPGYTIEDEADTDDTYPAGTLAMARTQAPDSGGSQFFIVYGETPLPPEYTVFGTVDEAGIAAIEEVAAEGNGPDGVAPKVPVDIETITLD